MSAGVCVIGGDPICSPSQAPLLIADFVKAMNSRPIGAYQVTPAMVEAFRNTGFSHIQVGKEAVF
jgi:lysylphosphatidylglycerol synthetase-like protein (DUF2156 family)